jgi:hypothetical protein
MRARSSSLLVLVAPTAWSLVVPFVYHTKRKNTQVRKGTQTKESVEARTSTKTRADPAGQRNIAIRHNTAVERCRECGDLGLFEFFSEQGGTGNQHLFKFACVLLLLEVGHLVLQPTLLIGSPGLRDNTLKRTGTTHILDPVPAQEKKSMSQTEEPKQRTQTSTHTEEPKQRAHTHTHTKERQQETHTHKRAASEGRPPPAMPSSGGRSLGGVGRTRRPRASILTNTPSTTCATMGKILSLSARSPGTK